MLYSLPTRRYLVIASSDMLTLTGAYQKNVTLPLEYLHGVVTMREKLVAKQSVRGSFMAKPKMQQCAPTGKSRAKTDPGCRPYPRQIESLGEFFSICNGLLKEDGVFWFRGHADLRWTLTPSALRYANAEVRNKALTLLRDFKRYAQIKLSHPPGRDDELEWVQLARHFGLPTRLLDWTRNAAIALYFACLRTPEKNDVDGAVFVLNPEDLNREADPKNARILDAHSDADRIARYLRLSGARNPRGLKTIAINPVWNSERIVLQQGAFTLHGSREFTLTRGQAPSLVCLKVPSENKRRLLSELERAGINEMSIFPEPEHMCRYLVWREKLDVLGAQ